MSRRLAFTATLVITTLAIPAMPASADGGCHSGVTQGTGTTVFLQDACPTPTILQVAPGSTVTFTNEDDFAHNIIGNLWGHYDDLNQGDTFTATFEEAGVYPYACWYHPGMTGAIVVGSGMGAGNGATVSLGSVTLPSPSPVAVVAAAEPVRPETDGVVGWIAGGAIGLALGAGSVLLLRRRRAA